jgi:hypothetical protein
VDVRVGWQFIGEMQRLSKGTVRCYHCVACQFVSVETTYKTNNVKSSLIICNCSAVTTSPTLVVYAFYDICTRFAKECLSPLI